MNLYINFERVSDDQLTFWSRRKVEGWGFPVLAIWTSQVNCF